MTDPFEEYDQKMWDLIRKYGWAVQYVMAGDDSPSFSYSIGLSAIPAPELITFALSPPVAQAILNDIAKTIRDGKRWKAGDRTDQFTAGGMELVFVDVADTTAHLTMANRMYVAAAPVPALQVVWPNTHGHYPWDLEWDMGPQVQPLLGTPPQT